MTRTVSFSGYLALWVFAIALALIEAAVVIYLRALGGNALFPLHDALRALGTHLNSLEVFREVATLVVLLVPAYLLQVSLLLRVAAYALVFAVWDLAYYGFLWLFLRWPGSLLTYDVLFLIPKPWVAPVICPIAVAVALMLGSTCYLCFARNRSVRSPSLLEFSALLIGIGILVLSFTWESDYYLRGGLPPRFAWWLFLPGYALALLGGAHLLFQFARQDKARFF
jgi:hypothetical protein